MTKVLLPKWWTEVDHDVAGETDAVVTYCCSSKPCYYVIVKEFEYEGYFGIKDLTIIGG